MELHPDEVAADFLPTLPTVPRGLWSYLYSVDLRPDLYDDISGYLRTLCELCSVENVLAVFFADTANSASYEEQWSELNRKRYQVCVCVCVCVCVRACACVYE